MPNGLGSPGRALWKSIVSEFDIDNEPAKQRILFDACKTADVIDRLDKETAREPLTVKGSMGQKTIHPCLAQAQTARGLLAMLLARLNFEGVSDDTR
jgi:hypothetical protein